MQNAIETTHKLDFLTAQNDFSLFRGDGNLFKVGTCRGQWGNTNDSYYILSVINEVKGNGHLDDVFEWFEYSCKRDGKNLLILECFNKRFYEHLITKRGFIPLDKDKCNCVKIFNPKQYKKLLKYGNEIIRPGTLACI